MGRQSLLRLWLNTWLVINACYVVFSWGYLFIYPHPASLAVNVSLYTLLCFSTIVGGIYIYRNLRFGVYLWLGVNIAVGFLSFMILSKVGWEVYVSLGAWFVTFHFLMIGGLWAQMRRGVDMAHFRHIYQLYGCMMLLVTVYGTYQVVQIGHQNEEVQNPVVIVDKLPEGLTQKELLERMDGISITLEQISQIESKITEMPVKYEARIMALRHLLAGHIMPDIHDLKAFQTAYFLRKGDLSSEQQKVLDWFFRQHNKVKDIWVESDGCQNLEIFQNRLRNVMKERNIDEF